MTLVLSFSERTARKIVDWQPEEKNAACKKNAVMIFRWSNIITDFLGECGLPLNVCMQTEEMTVHACVKRSAVAGDNGSSSPNQPGYQR